MRISDGSADVCSSDREPRGSQRRHAAELAAAEDADGGARGKRARERAGGRRGGRAAGLGHCAPSVPGVHGGVFRRSEEHTSELQSLMRISYAVFCLKKNKIQQSNTCAAPETNTLSIINLVTN